LVILALLQVTVVPRVPLLNVYPDLVLLAVLAWTMVRGVREGAIEAFVGGIMLDLLSSQPLGSHALALILTVIPTGLLGEPVYRGNLAFPVLGAFLATFLYNGILLLMSRLFGEAVNWGNTLWRIVLPLALVQSILMPLTYWLVDRLDRRLDRRMRIG
jgi:rod shape-determining protein MreD